MSDGVAPMRPLPVPGRRRVGLAASAAVAVALVLLPPLVTLARRDEWAEALQFSILAVVGPALVVVGAPWRALRLPPSLLDRLAAGRRRHRELIRSLGFLVADLAVMVVWRTPAAVDALSSRPWLVVVEAVCLLAFGIGLWLELVDSPPLAPRSAHPRRAVLAALAMWTIWTVAYMVAMSHAPWYTAFHHRAGTGLSASADRQLSAIVLWTTAAVAFIPVVFWNLVQWLRDEDDPDDELVSLLREERRRSTGAR
jgi:cytochrome c oxidase assembly factor CtaG